MRFAARNEDVVPMHSYEKTTGETWNVANRPNHWYAASTAFAIECLGAGEGRSCLVIGSPVYEAVQLRDYGWDVTYMDVRIPPTEAGKTIICDATEMTLPDESFDAVSSACVLTHAGTGRYGDSDKREHGDEIMLGHIARVMREVAVLTFGACADMPRMKRVGSAHRIYTVQECERMLHDAGLSVDRKRIWSQATKDWIPDGTPPTRDDNNPDYISFMVTK